MIFAAGKTFAEIIVGVAFELERYPRRHEGAEALPRRALEVKMNRVFGQALRSEAARHLAAKDRPDDAVGVADIQRWL